MDKTDHLSHSQLSLHAGSHRMFFCFHFCLFAISLILVAGRKNLFQKKQKGSDKNVELVQLVTIGCIGFISLAG